MTWVDVYSVGFSTGIMLIVYTRIPGQQKALSWSPFPVIPFSCFYWLFPPLHAEEGACGSDLVLGHVQDEVKGGSSRHWPKMTPSGLSTEGQSITKKVVMLLVDLSKKVWKHNFLITVTFFVLFAYCTLSLDSLCIIPYLILYGGSSLGSVNLLSCPKFAWFQLFLQHLFCFFITKYIYFFHYSICLTISLLLWVCS